MSPAEGSPERLPAAVSAKGKCPLLLLASSNAGKIAEFRLGVRRFLPVAGRSALQTWPWKVEPVPEIETLPACVEDGETFSANAQIKALHYSRLANALVLADDSGLEVDALGGAPGVRSRRFAGPHATDAQNNAKLLDQMRGAPPAQRGGQFVCALALARCGQSVAEFCGVRRGLILEIPRGGGGFGYDPLFLDLECNKTFAEMSPEEKLEHSHRGVALRAMRDWLARNPHWFCSER